MHKKLALWIGMLAVIGMLANPTSAADLSGKWDFILYTEGGDHRVTATLEVQGDAVSGTWGEVPVQGRFADNAFDLKFPISVPDFQMQGDLRVQGTLEGDRASGSWEFEGYGGRLSASRSLPPDPNGVWEFVFYTESGERRAPITLNVDGETARVLFDSNEVLGSFKERTLDLNFPYDSPDAGFRSDLKINGTLSGDTFEGTWAFDEYSGRWRGFRK